MYWSFLPYTLFIVVPLSIYWQYVILEEIKDFHPEYYNGMNGFSLVFGNHARGGWLLFKFALFYRSEIERGHVKRKCLYYLASVLYVLLVIARGFLASL